MSPTATPSAPPPSLLRRTAIALAICGVAIGVRYLLDPIFGAQHSFITSFVAVAITAYLAGPGLPTLLAIAVTYGAASWLFLPPRHSFALPSPAHGDRRRLRPPPREAAGSARAGADPRGVSQADWPRPSTTLRYAQGDRRDFRSRFATFSAPLQVPFALSVAAKRRSRSAFSSRSRTSDRHFHAA